jgi:hypothetical protein
MAGRMVVASASIPKTAMNLRIIFRQLCYSFGEIDATHGLV